MLKYENDCVGCPPELGCLGNSCFYRNIPHYYCDKCGEEDVLYIFDDKQLCQDCLLSNFDKVGE